MRGTILSECDCCFRAAPLLALMASLAAQTAPRQVTTIVAGGTVVTVDGARNIYNPGAVAIDGTTIVAV